MSENIGTSISTDSQTQYTNITLSNDVDIESNVNNLLQQVRRNQTNYTNSNKFKCFGIVMGLFFLIGIIGLAITYIVYVIISLCETSYHEQKDMCDSSNAWLYLLLSIILGTVISSTKSSRFNSNNTSESSDNSIYSFIEILYFLAFTIWGCIELFQVDCVDELKHTLLYTMLKISVFAEIVGLGFLMLSCFIACCILDSEQEIRLTNTQ